MHQQYTIDVQDGRAALQDRGFVDAWDQLVAQQPFPTKVYASPDWVAHLDATSDRPLRVWSLRDGAGEVVGVVPVQQGTYTLRFSAYQRVLFRKRLSTAHLLGSNPALPADGGGFRQLLAGIFDDWPECQSIYGDAIATDSEFGGMLQNPASQLKGFRPYIVSGPRPWHTIELDVSFDAYLKSMTSKARANLRRSARQLKEHAGGQLSLRRFSDPSDAEDLFRGVVEVSRQTWQHQVIGTRISDDAATLESYHDLAGRGLLRSYLLSIGDKPCAFAIGYQHYGVYCYDEVGYDQSLAEYSPGKVLLFLIIEDLHAENRPDVLDFGVGDATYKRRFGNRMANDAAVLLMRRSAGNEALLAGHSLFTRSVGFAKKLIGRRVTK